MHNGHIWTVHGGLIDTNTRSLVDVEKKMSYWHPSLLMVGWPNCGPGLDVQNWLGPLSEHRKKCSWVHLESYMSACTEFPKTVDFSSFLLLLGYYEFLALCEVSFLSECVCVCARMWIWVATETVRDDRVRLCTVPEVLLHKNTSSINVRMQVQNPRSAQ